MTIHFAAINESFIQLQGDTDILREIQAIYSFEIPGKRFHPAFKAGKWDGIIRLVDRYGRVSKGLFQEILRYCIESEIKVSVDPILKLIGEPVEFDEASLKMPWPLRDYQVEAIQKVLKTKRRLLISPTSSGKSAILGALIRTIDVPTLVIVPNISLLAQIEADLNNYFGKSGWVAEDHCIFIGDGVRASGPTVGRKFVFSTWQSLQRLDPEFFLPFQMVMCDEVHKATSTQIQKIVHQCVNAFWRVGMTGTLDGSKTNEKTLVGLFGPKHVTTTTKALMDSGQVAKAEVHPIILKYPEEFCKECRGLPYDDEIEVLMKNQPRNEFLANLPSQMTGNSLFLLKSIEVHGKSLLKILCEKNPGHQIFLIEAKTKKAERERIRQLAESHDNVIIIATYSLFAEGVSINNLYNVVFASPMKGKVKVLQSIGRGLRLHDDDKVAIIWDIVDDLRGKYKKQNYALGHFMVRLEAYMADKFKVITKEIQL